MVTTAVMSLTVALSAAPTAHAEELVQPRRPPLLTVTASDLTVTATLGSYCWAESNAGGCADTIGILPTRGRLPVTSGQRLVIDTQAPASHLDVVLLRVKYRTPLFRSRAKQLREVGGVKARNRSATRWNLVLPQHLRRATTLAIYVTYPNGDGTFWAGIDTRACHE